MTVVVFFQVPATKFKSNFSGVLFTTSSSQQYQSSKSRRELSHGKNRMVQVKKHKNMVKPRTL